jgi:hypothetical protein
VACARLQANVLRKPSSSQGGHAGLNGLAASGTRIARTRPKTRFLEQAYAELPLTGHVYPRLQPVGPQIVQGF